MSGIVTRRLAGLVLVGLLAPPPAPAFPADDRSPEEILAAIEAVEDPKLDSSRREDLAYIQEYIQLRDEAASRRASLIGELYRIAPDHPRLPGLMPTRWMALMSSPATVAEVGNEIEAIIADESSPLRTEAAYYRAVLAMRRGEGGDQGILDPIEAFIAIAPKDERGGNLLYQAVSYFLRDQTPERKSAILDRVVEQYPDSRVARMALAERKKTEAVGEPFELTFNEAITGRTISVQDDLKGKVVVIDFWATWCGPCVAEMPTMKSLYAEYKDKGVEFIGVSLDSPEDEGGLDALKAFVEENEIPWPQYYQGNGWESEFSSSWGINAIPSVFVIDQKGTLYSTQARGQLETMIPELLAKAAPAGEE
ncbi:TlpA disulfide reductase family protein [Tautonia sociabilis]|nr:TlpA disulfide reductase family protein [Tautonia sociabilis]